MFLDDNNDFSNNNHDIMSDEDSEIIFSPVATKPTKNSEKQIETSNIQFKLNDDTDTDNSIIFSNETNEKKDNIIDFSVENFPALTSKSSDNRKRNKIFENDSKTLVKHRNNHHVLKHQQDHVHTLDDSELDDSEIAISSSASSHDGNMIAKSSNEINLKKKNDSNNTTTTTGPQYFYIQMEFCGGKTMRDLIDNGLYRDEETVWRFFREILQGLHHIHEQGMIHRDLKPGNVLIDNSRDINGKAKIGDFGLATSKFQKVTPNTNYISGSNNSNEIQSANNNSNIAASIMSTSLNPDVCTSTNGEFLSQLSGAVGTALYVAPELLEPMKKNRFFYTQKVDIYSLGILFYEMCFPFATTMERIYVIQKLRQKEIIFPDNIDTQKYEKQIKLIRSMLQHDPNKRPSAKDLLRDETIPRKADEIALDELLDYSLLNKQSTNYTKILKAIFDQQNPKAEDLSYDLSGKSSIGSISYLQLKETVFERLRHIFQNHGGYMISTPILTPLNDLNNDYNKVFKIVDPSGLLVSLPYNHRLPFARMLALNNHTNIKRYYIGRVYQVVYEEYKRMGFHPKEHIEASFDIVTPFGNDCIPDIEILSIVQDVINEFQKLKDREYRLVVNHMSVLNAILIHSGIEEKFHKKIYYILSNFTKLTIKSNNASKEISFNYLREKLKSIEVEDSLIPKFLNFILKYDEASKVIDSLKYLTKKDSYHSKLAKENLNQLKLITSNLSSLGFKMPVFVSTSFVLPVISHPFEYSGFVFQLLIQRKKTVEYDILASGGRYDKMITNFRTTNDSPQQQFAVGVSFDFERIVDLISEKSKDKSKETFRSEFLVCSIGHSVSSSNTGSSSALTLAQTDTDKHSSSLTNIKQSLQQQLNTRTELNKTNNSLFQQCFSNSIRLFRHVSSLNKHLRISSHLSHGKFSSVAEIDEYCLDHGINAYAYFKDTSPSLTTMIFNNNPIYDSSNDINNDNLNENDTTTQISIKKSNNNISNDNNTSTTTTTINNNNNNNNNKAMSSSPNTSSSSNLPCDDNIIRIRILIDRKRFIEKKYPLNDFLHAINNLTHQFNSIQSSNLLNNTSLTNRSLKPLCYSDVLNAAFTNNCSVGGLSTIASSSSTLPANTNSTSTTQVSSLSQLNITLLLDATNVNRRRIEAQITSKLTSVLSLFSTRTRIEIIAMEMPDNVIQALANFLHLDMEESAFNSNWAHSIERMNAKYRRQLSNVLRLDEIIHELRYIKKSKVFILYSCKTEQFKLLVAP
jgi:serine/threonine protein kinase